MIAKSPVPCRFRTSERARGDKAADAGEASPKAVSIYNSHCVLVSASTFAVLTPTVRLRT